MIARLGWWETGLGIGVLALGLFIAFETATMEVGPTYARVGPRLFPALIATGLLVTGAALVAEALFGRVTTERERLAPGPLLFVALGIAAQILLLNRAGFILSSTVMFAFTARGFDSRRPVTDVAIGLALAIVVYIAFTRGLGLNLPKGVFATLGIL